MTKKHPPIKSANFPTMNDYKSAAQASHGAKLQSMGVMPSGAGHARLSSIDVTQGPAAAKEMAGMESEAQNDADFARGGGIPHRKPSTINVTHGKAAEKEMAEIERQAKVIRGRSSKKD